MLKTSIAALALDGDPGYVPSAGKWVLGALIALWVTVPAAVQALLVLMVMDYVTGLICALLTGTFCAAEGFRGIARKTLTLLLVAMAWYVGRIWDAGQNVGGTVAFAFSANEMVSIVVNCARAGVPIPEPLLVVVGKVKQSAGRDKTAREVMQQLRGKGSEKRKSHGD